MKYEVIIIGGGVAGMTAAIYLKRSGVNCLILEGSMPGGQVVSNDHIENYPGFLSIRGSDLALAILKQIKSLAIPINYEKVQEITVEDGYKYIKTANSVYKSQYVILATGRVPKSLGVSSEEKFRNRGISYCAVCDGMLYKDKDVVVIGGGNSALEAVLYLSPFVRHVTLLHRRESYRAAGITVERVRDLSNISLVMDEVETFDGDKNLSSIKLKSGKVISCDGVFIYVGQTPNTSFLENLSILAEDGYIEVDEDYETKQKGIYAVGDCIRKKHYQIVIAMGEAASCALDIRRKIR